MDNRTPEQRRKNMQNIKPKNTKPEKILMKDYTQSGSVALTISIQEKSCMES
jgi:G:T-mismatch repair DNA endonuclease (very short patch repair protein)